MKKTMITRIIVAALALTMIISPVTADAAEKKTVTRDEYSAYKWDLLDKADVGDITSEEYHAAMYDYVASLNGCYNEKGVKIYTVLDGKTKKITKTGKYDIVVGGKKAKTDQGTIKFVAPKAGTYKFTFSVKNNVTGQNVCIFPKNQAFKGMKKDYYYTVNGKTYKTDNSGYILLAVKGSCTYYNDGTYLDNQAGRSYSKMKTLSGTVKLKKGETVVLECRNPNAALNETSAYRFTDFVVSITKK